MTEQKLEQTVRKLQVVKMVECPKLENVRVNTRMVDTREECGKCEYFKAWPLDQQTLKCSYP